VLETRSGRPRGSALRRPRGSAAGIVSRAGRSSGRRSNISRSATFRPMPDRRSRARRAPKSDHRLAGNRTQGELWDDLRDRRCDLHDRCPPHSARATRPVRSPVRESGRPGDPRVVQVLLEGVVRRQRSNSTGACASGRLLIRVTIGIRLSTVDSDTTRNPSQTIDEPAYRRRIRQRAARHGKQ
jgi:hypothetical protein